MSDTELEYCLKYECGASCDYEPANLHKACCITSTDKRRKRDMAVDKYVNLVFLAESARAL